MGAKITEFLKKVLSISKYVNAFTAAISTFIVKIEEIDKKESSNNENNNQ